MKITINKAMVDYLTVTTESDNERSIWAGQLTHETEWEWSEIKRYSGIRGKGEYAGVFIGTSVGNTKKHHIIQVSGAIADEILTWLDPFDIRSGLIRVTRIDVQVTISQPEGWSQWGYAEACQAYGLKPTIQRSPDPINKKGELITVYTGTKKSGRLNRLYQKVMESGELLIRYETEFSRGYAKSIAYEILSGKTKKEAIIKGEINRRKVPSLEMFNLWQLGLFTPKQEKRIAIDKRGNWLYCDILPIFTEYVNRHDADPRIADAFLSAIENFGGF